MTKLSNRPGLQQLQYRAGTFNSFHTAMLQKAGDAYGETLLDAWAYVGDILTFYQERYIQEAFLRTAIHRDSLQRLGALLAYRPAPGVSAHTDVAFQVESGPPVELPAGLRIQSLAGPGEQPRKYETVESVTAHEALNRLPIRPLVARVANPFSAGATSGLIQPGFDPAGFRTGDNLLWINSADSSVVEKRIERLDAENGLTRLTFSPPLQADSAYESTGLFTYRRRFRLFGHNAPPSYIPVGKTEPVRTDYIRQEATYLDLEGPVEGLRANTQVLILFQAVEKPEQSIQPNRFELQRSAMKLEQPEPTWSIQLATISKVVPGSSSVGGKSAAPLLTGPTTRIYLDQAVSLRIDQAIIYELDRPVPLWDAAYPDSIPTGATELLLPLHELPFTAAEAERLLVRDRVLLLDDGQGSPQRVTVVGLTEESDPLPHLRVTFTPALRRPLQTASAVLYGNIALATHGESLPAEVLGSGDPAVAGQRFTLKRNPITYRAMGDGEVRSSLTIRVDGVHWTEVESFLGQSPQAQVYVTELDEAGNLCVRFGDGVHGARLPRGEGNVVAQYRIGTGADGTVRAQTLTTLLDRPRGLRGAINPGPASGGRNGESIQTLRTAIPARVQTLNRAVSLQDFEALALRYPGVAKVQAERLWDGLGQVIHLTVAGAAGAPVDLDGLRRFLDARREPSNPLVVAAGGLVTVAVGLLLQVKPNWDGLAVERAVHAALTNHLSLTSRSFGETIYPSDLYHIAQRVDGVAALHLTEFRRRTESKGVATRVALKRAHRAEEPGQVYPAEIVAHSEITLQRRETL